MTLLHQFKTEQIITVLSKFIWKQINDEMNTVFLKNILNGYSGHNHAWMLKAILDRH